MQVAAINLLVNNHPVETLFGGLANQFFRQRNMFLGRKSEAANDAAEFVLRSLDALRNLHLLFPGQQRHLAHLLEIHPHRIVQNIEPRLFFIFIAV